MTEPNPDLQRMREEYARRASSSAYGERYSRANPANEWNILARRRAIVDFLERYVGELSQLRVLDMGCGSGGVLTRLVELGADPANLIGVDLLPD